MKKISEQTNTATRNATDVKNCVGRMFYSGYSRGVVYHHHDGSLFLGMTGDIACRDDVVFVKCDTCTINLCYFKIYGVGLSRVGFYHVGKHSLGEQGDRQDADDD